MIIEKYKIKDRDIYVARDDLTAPFPGPNNAKIRGLEDKILSIREEGYKIVVSQNTRISRLGWAVSFVCSKLDLRHVDFYPDAGMKGIPFYQKMSQYYGGELHPLRGTHQRIFTSMINSYLKTHDIKGYLLPIGLAMPEAVMGHANSIQEIPTDLLQGSLIVPSSSGTTFAGLTYGCLINGLEPDTTCVVSSKFSDRRNKILQIIENTESKVRELPFGAFNTIKFRLIQLDKAYGKPENFDCPFPNDIYLDRPAWKWLYENIDLLSDPILFWNIGGEWNPITGLEGNLRGDGKVKLEDIRKILMVN